MQHVVVLCVYIVYDVTWLSFKDRNLYMSIQIFEY